jgi:NADPH:quinone reductase-like Zn-dependent oxidoreductase
MSPFTAITLVAFALGLVPGTTAAGSMRAIQVAEFGSLDVLSLQEVARPTPGHGELLVRVHAAAVNPVDALVRGGQTKGFIDVELPHVPGYDISGTVEATGAAADGFAAGDPVFAMLPLTRGGGYADYAIVTASDAAAKPARLSHAESAALPLVSLTAWQALVEIAALSAGQRVLVHGGSGGVGSMAIQIAKARGAHVTASASAGNLDYLRSLGADVVVDYRNQRFEDHVSDIDVVLDPIGGGTQQRSLEVLKDGGVLVSLVGLGAAARTPPRGIRAVSMLVRPDGAQLREIAALVDTDKLRPEVTLLLPLARVVEAHEQIETGHTRGKVVLVVVE